MQRRRNTGAMLILPMITLLREFLIVSCVLCVPQVDSSLYQIKHCLSLVLYVKYSTQRVVSRRNIALGFASCYICLSPTLFVLYFPYSTRGSALSSTYRFKVSKISNSPKLYPKAMMLMWHLKSFSIYTLYLIQFPQVGWCFYHKMIILFVT